MYDLDERKPNTKKEAEISNEFSVMCEIYFVNCRTKPVQLAGQNFNMRVWSWLRMNAGGVPNTCKSNEV